MTMRRTICLPVIMGAWLVLGAGMLPAQEKDPGARWKDFGFLLGAWEGKGSGASGEGVGGFTFATDLQGTILVRRNRADYPAAKDRQAFSHEDLMILTRDPGGPVRAVYFDNEGHVIQYGVTARADSVIFLSDSIAGSPRYRLGYFPTSADTVRLTFDIAPPGKGSRFTRYIEASAFRHKAAHQETGP